MKTSSSNKRSGRRKIWIPLILVLILVAGAAGGYLWYTRSLSTTSTTSSETTNTTKVRSGSITISISGSGTLVSGSESNLSFTASGTVGKLNVQVGDTVKKGDVLASLQDTSALEASVATAQQNLETAQKALDTLQSGAAASLANAQLAVIDAKKALTDAQDNVVTGSMARCDTTTTELYYYNYTRAVDALNQLDQTRTGEYYVNQVVPAKNKVAQAYATYEYCAGYTTYEIDSSTANVSLAQANLKTAQATLDTLAKNNGIDPLDLASAQNDVTNAQLSLDQAQKKLEGATLIAPFDGTIISVAGNQGDAVDTGTFITIADLNHPQVKFSIDETDLAKLAVGEEANITFDAYPTEKFVGKVLRINPALETSSNVLVATGTIEIDLSQQKTSVTLPQGLTATVEIVQASAKDVAIVSLEALRDLGDGTYAAFVVGSDGKPVMHVVTIGLQDSASAEVKSGLSVGDTVTTGSAQTN